MAVVECAECGVTSPEGVQFCGECGAFLDWEAAPAEPQPPTTVPAAPEQAPVTPEAVRPGESRARRHVVVPDEPLPRDPDERPCPSCAVGNATSRRFCRACGAPLAQVAAPPRPPWWRRWWARWTAKRAYAAGTRRRVRGGRGARRVVWLLLVAVLVVLAVVAVPTGLLRWADEGVRDHFTTSFRVAARPGQASSAARGAGPANLVDGASNRYWAPAGKAVGAWVELGFPGPVRLLRVIVTAGVSSDAALFAARGRPHELTAVVLTSSGPAPARTIALRDQPGPQYFDVRVSDATGIRLTVTSTYGMPPAHVCALAELEFDAR